MDGDSHGDTHGDMDDVLVVGEALVDIVEGVDGRRSEHPGGSPANVALGLSRLGRQVRLLTRFGTDARGQTIQELLDASGVHVVPASRTDDPTSTAAASIDARGLPTYDFRIDWRLPPHVRGLDDLAPTRALHTGSIATFLPPGGDDVLALVADAAGRVTVTYDPNARPRLMGEPAAARQRVETFVRHADVVKVSDEDLRWLAPGEDPIDVVSHWLTLGPAVVVLTRGGQGAFGVCAAGSVEVEAATIEVVDTVGAGDSFMSALIDHLAGADLLGPSRREALHAIDPQDVAAMLRYAIRVSAITCQRVGADPPTRAELDALTTG